MELLTKAYRKEAGIALLTSGKVDFKPKLGKEIKAVASHSSRNEFIRKTVQL